MTQPDRKLPRMFRVRQSLSDQPVADVPAAVRSQLQALRLTEKVRSGETVAITVGSRGIANIAVITRAMVEFFAEAGAEPFIVPAMGSHGAATPVGQQSIIEKYGVTEQFCGCPIRSNMDTVTVCQAEEGFPVHFDRLAFEADHVVVANRIKPHTDFTGAIESGLMKMMLIGLGKQDGAEVYHRAIQDYDFDRIVRSVGREVISRCNVLAGLAIVEDGLDQTAHIEAIQPNDIESREAQLLTMAKTLMPALPFREAGLLLVDQIGKNISGAGMDTNIIGRKFYDHQAVDDEWPRIKRIAIRSIAPESQGNATGIGIAEFCLKQAVDQLDYETTRINCITSGHVTAGMMPIWFDNDREMLTESLKTIGLVAPADARMMWIRNTLELLEVECSEAFLEEARERSDLSVIHPPRELKFDDHGMLTQPF